MNAPLTPPGAAPNAALTGNALSAAETERVQRYQQRLLAALHARDRDALHAAKQQVLHAAWRQAAPPAQRAALRQLAWRMAGWLLPRKG